MRGPYLNPPALRPSPSSSYSNLPQTQSALHPPLPKPTPVPNPNPIPIRILTHNIRYATTSPFPGELPWPTRLPGLLAELEYHTRHNPTAIVCLQEVLDPQLRDILHGLNNIRSNQSHRSWSPPHPAPSPEATERGPDSDPNPEWTHYGLARDDGRRQGEYSPILFRASVWKAILTKTMWLSPTPEVPGSKGWDAASVRICGAVVLECRGGWCGGATPRQMGATGMRGRRGGGGEGARRVVLVLNTHLDDQGRRSRVEGAKLILREIRELRREWPAVEGVVLAGDLNSEASVRGSSSRTGNEKDSKTDNIHVSSTTRSEASGATSHLNHSETEEDNAAAAAATDEEQEDAWSILNAPSSGLRDLRSFVPAEERYGHEMTFTGFNGRGDGEGRCTRIDFIHINAGVLNGTGRCGSSGYDRDDVVHERDGDAEGEGEGEVEVSIGETEIPAKSGAGGGEDMGEQQQQQHLAERDHDTNPLQRKKASPTLTEQGQDENEKEKEKRPKPPWHTKGYAVLPNIFDDGTYISDHRAVVGDLVLET